MSEQNPSGLTRRQLIERAAVAGAAASVVPARAAWAGEPDEKLPQVPRRRLGKTGETIPILVMGGSMKFDQRFDPKLAECLRFGVNYFDVADCYAGGTSETAVGNFHSRLKNRDQIWITSKSDAHDPDGFERTVDQSLRKMKTDYINLYYLHGLKDPDYLTPALAKRVEKLKKAGKIRHFGFSCHGGNVDELLQKAATLPWVESIMFRYNFRRYGDKELNAAIDACKKADIGLIAMKVQGSEASFADAWKKFEKTGKWTKHQAVLKAVWADDRITAAISQMDNFEKLKQNIAAAVDRSKLSSAEVDALQRYAEATRAFACDGCDHLCNPAVDAPVQIGDTMRYLMYNDVYDQPDVARDLFRTRLPIAAQRLKGVDFARANAACPHGVDIAHHMARAAELFEV